MRKMMKKAIALGLIATMSMSAATIVHAEDEVTLRVLNWGNTDEEKIANDAIARFNEENPNVKVEQTCVPVESWSDFIQKWITMCTSGEAPDVISLGLEAVNMAVSNDLLVPLDDIITDDEELTAKKDQYAPSLLEGFTVNDSLYGLPNGTQTIVKERIEGGANEKAVWRLFINCPFVCINFDFFWLNKVRQLYMDF